MVAYVSAHLTWNRTCENITQMLKLFHPMEKSDKGQGTVQCLLMNRKSCPEVSIEIPSIYIKDGVTEYIFKWFFALSFYVCIIYVYSRASVRIGLSKPVWIPCSFAVDLPRWYLLGRLCFLQHFKNWLPSRCPGGYHLYIISFLLHWSTLDNRWINILCEFNAIELLWNYNIPTTDNTATIKLILM